MKFKSTTNLGEIAPRLAFIDNSKGIASKQSKNGY